MKKTIVLFFALTALSAFASSKVDFNCQTANGEKMSISIAGKSWNAEIAGVGKSVIDAMAQEDAPFAVKGDYVFYQLTDLGDGDTDFYKILLPTQFNKKKAFKTTVVEISDRSKKLIQTHYNCARD